MSLTAQTQIVPGSGLPLVAGSLHGLPLPLARAAGERAKGDEQGDFSDFFARGTAQFLLNIPAPSSKMSLESIKSQTESYTDPATFLPLADSPSRQSNLSGSPDSQVSPNLSASLRAIPSQEGTTPTAIAQGPSEEEFSMMSDKIAVALDQAGRVDPGHTIYRRPLLSTSMAMDTDRPVVAPSSGAETDLRALPSAPAQNAAAVNSLCVLEPAIVPQALIEGQTTKDAVIMAKAVAELAVSQNNIGFSQSHAVLPEHKQLLARQTGQVEFLERHMDMAVSIKTLPESRPTGHLQQSSGMAALPAPTLPATAALSPVPPNWSFANVPTNPVLQAESDLVMQLPTTSIASTHPTVVEDQMLLTSRPPTKIPDPEHPIQKDGTTRARDFLPSPRNPDSVASFLTQYRAETLATGTYALRAGENVVQIAAMSPFVATFVPGVAASPGSLDKMVAIELTTLFSGQLSTPPRVETMELRSEFSRPVVQQLLDASLRAIERPVELHLNPEELGRVRISMTISEASVTLNVQAERADTLELMRRHSDLLAQELRQLGYGMISFSFGQDSSGQDGQTDKNAQAASGDATDPAATEQLNTAPRRTETGLDIRV